MIEQLFWRINGEVERLLRAACGEERGWPEAVRQAGLPPGPPTSGPAPAEQVHAVLEALVQEALQAIDQLPPGTDPACVAGLRQRLGLLADHETRRYADAVQRAAAEAPPPGPTSGVGAIFRNAVQTYEMRPWAHLEWDSRITITCRTCGAPQRTRRDFTCEFCGGQMFTRDGEGS